MVPSCLETLAGRGHCMHIHPLSSSPVHFYVLHEERCYGKPALDDIFCWQVSIFVAAIVQLMFHLPTERAGDHKRVPVYPGGCEGLINTPRETIKQRHELSWRISQEDAQVSGRRSAAISAPPILRRFTNCLASAMMSSIMAPDRTTPQLLAPTRAEIDKFLVSRAATQRVMLLASPTVPA
jgi:hypothetical protein